MTACKEPVEFELGKRPSKPTEQETRGAWQCDLAERDSQRKLEERCAVGTRERKKGAFDLATALAVSCVLGNNKEPGARVGGKLVPAPKRAGVEFGLGVGALVGVNQFRCTAWDGLPPGAPCVEDRPLGRQDAVEAS